MLNVLFYGNRAISKGGGPGKVAYYLSEALKNKVNITCFDGIRSNIGFPEIYADVFSRFFKKEFDIFHFGTSPSWNNGSSMLLRFSKLRQTGTVLNIHGIEQIERNVEHWYVPISHATWTNTINNFRFADRVVVNSEYIRRHAISLYKTDPNKVVVIPNGVDLERFAKGNDEILLDGEPSLLYVGHFARLKGVDLLIRSMAKVKLELPKVKLHLVGRGNVHAFWLVAKKHGVENQVIFHDWVDQPILSSYYRSADICVFPSRHEGFGLVILEAMASGVPVIASNIPSFQELVSNENDGVLFRSEDENDLSEEIVSLWQDPQRRRKLSQNAFKKAKGYSWENIADKYVSLYKSLLK